MRKRRIAKRLLIAVVLLGAIALCQDDEPAIEQALYNEMVDLYEASNGQHGWPDYRNERGGATDE